MAAIGRRDYTITKLERSPEGYWQANLTMDGITVQVDRRPGCWRITPRAGELGETHLRFEFASALQARVRPIEKKEEKAREDSKRTRQAA